MSKVQYGILHCHTEHSVRDSAMSVAELIARAKELGAPAVALTDHGILAGIIDFVKAAKKEGVKPMPGIEAYYVPNGAENSLKPRHLILMAKDYQGYQAICRAVYQSYQYIYRDHPCMDDAILKKVFGPGGIGHDHVIATSACVGGVLSEILLEDDTLEKSTESLMRRRDKYHPLDDEVLDMVHHEEELAAEVAQLTALRDEYFEASKVSVAGLQRALKGMKPGSKEYDETKRSLDFAISEKERVKNELADIKVKLANKKREKSAYSKSIADTKKGAEKWADYDDQINAILANRQGEAALVEKAKTACAEFGKIFGEGNWYVEVQYHHISNEAKTMPVLASIAKELGVPVVAANDAHYATNSRDDVRARSLIAALRFGEQIVEDEEGHGELYVRDDEELTAALSEILDDATVAEAMANVGKIVDACNVEMAHGEHYPVFPGDGTETASQRLRRLAEEGISVKYPGKMWTEEYRERMEYELNVIDTMGYSDYLCIVQDYLDYGRQLGTNNNPEKIGYAIGPGRGSAAGSIVCYLTGITSVDPMKYGLLFERFLNPQRVSMPDIDADFSAEVREDVIEYVKNKYRSPDKDPETTTPICSILTKGRMAAKMALRNAARVTNVPLSVADNLARMVKDPKQRIADIPEIAAACETNPVARQLVADAKLIEGKLNSYGVHAAGIIIADNGDVGEYVPLYRATDKGKAIGPWVSQLEMSQVEKDAGLLKMDMLGLKNLDIISDTLRRIYRHTGTRIDIEKLEDEPEVYSKIFAAGNTNSVFQFESGGMVNMLRQFKPSTFEELILLVAAYRPGPLQYVPSIIKSKFGQERPRYIADGLEEILAPTYGYPIYQEQVMQIFNRIAGFSLGEADIIRRAMAKKHLEELTNPETDYHGKFIRGLMSNGASETDAEDFWNQLLDFANYA